MLIKQIYNQNPLTIQTGVSVKEALLSLIHEDANGLLVVDKNNKLVGIFSLQDIAAATVPYEMKEHHNLASSMFKEGFFADQCREIQDKKIEEVMRKDFLKVSSDANIMEIMADFLNNDLYIVPVYENNELKGVITRTEIKKALVSAMNPS